MSGEVYRHPSDRCAWNAAKRAAIPVGKSMRRWQSRDVLRTLLALTLLGCGPTSLWRARSADLAQVIEARSEDGGERAYVDGAPGERFAVISAAGVAFGMGAHYLAEGSDGAWQVVSPDGAGPPFLDVAIPLQVAGERALYAAADARGWHVVLGREVGPAYAAVDRVAARADGTVRYVARDAAGQRVVVDGTSGPTFLEVSALTEGRALVYAGRVAGGEHVVVDGVVQPTLHETVLELVSARDAAAFAAIVGAGERTELWHAPPGGPAILLGAASVLSHLRISDDGAHVACLSAQSDGQSIEVWRDGSVVARHRRIEGERLAFVGGEDRLTWLAADAQGVNVVIDGAASERFESIDGPIVGRGGVGFIGRRRGRSEVWVDGERVIEADHATSLNVGADGHFAVMVRSNGERFVVTRRGRWPIPRFFVDTLAIDVRGEHWGALVPDASERELSVWIDGEAVAVVPAEELLAPAMAMGVDPAVALRAVVVAALGRRAVRVETEPLRAEGAEE